MVVVTDRAQLQRLAGVWRGAGHVAGSAATVALIAPAIDDAFRTATLQFDLGQLAMTLILAATDLGVGAGHTAVSEQELARELLGFPEDHFCAWLIALGSLPGGRPDPAAQEAQPPSLRGRRTHGALVGAVTCPGAPRSVHHAAADLVFAVRGLVRSTLTMRAGRPGGRPWPPARPRPRRNRRRWCRRRCRPGGRPSWRRSCAGWNRGCAPRWRGRWVRRAPRRRRFRGGSLLHRSDHRRWAGARQASSRVTPRGGSCRRP